MYKCETSVFQIPAFYKIFSKKFFLYSCVITAISKKGPNYDIFKGCLSQHRLSKVFLIPLLGRHVPILMFFNLNLLHVSK